jgi:hypothetical protein
MKRLLLALLLLSAPALGQTKFSLLNQATPAPGGATGDIWYASSATQVARLGIGTDGYCLKIDNATHLPAWAACIATPLAVGSGGTGAATLTGILRGNGTSAFTTGAIALGSADVSGTLPVVRGGTGAATTSANYIFAGPSSGADAAPSFRAMAEADLPSSLVFESSALTNTYIPRADGFGRLVDSPVAIGVTYSEATNASQPRIVCWQTNTATQTIAGSGNATLTFDANSSTTGENTASGYPMHSTSSNNDRLYAPVAGFYLAIGGLASNNATGAQVFLDIILASTGKIKGRSSWMDGGALLRMEVMGVFQMSAGDYITFKATMQNATGLGTTGSGASNNETWGSLTKLW